MLKQNHSFTFLRGEKRKKSEEIFEVLGDLDELIAALGLVRAFCDNKSFRRLLEGFQEDLIKIGGFLSSITKEISLEGPIADLEARILQFEDPRIKRFSRPGVNKSSAFLHWARAVCRRLERKVVGLKNKSFKPIIAYLNRLSLVLFWMAIKEEK